jgi:type IV secretory pathway protease TraF
MPDHSDAFSPFDLGLKIPLWSKLGCFIHSHFHFLIAVDLANSNYDCDYHQPVPAIIIIIIVQPLLNCAPFFVTLHSY